MNYNIVFTKNALKDYQQILQSPYRETVKQILTILKTNPFQQPFEPLIGNLKGMYSRRINIKHRIVYEINQESKTITVRAMWGHYDDN